MKTATAKWVCPKCSKKNTYELKFELGIPVVIGDPACKKCNLRRFDNEYYELVKISKTKGGKQND